MARVPFIGRLFWREYLALSGSFILIFLEAFIRIITLGLPQPVIRFCYNRSKSLFNFLSSKQGQRARSKKRSIVSSIANASDFVDLCAIYGYYAEEHVVQTGDGYLLGLHRLGWRRGEEGIRVNAGKGSVAKRVVYLHHGLMMNSEVWVCLTDKERCLPFALVDQGFDVWLGNNRGNKYSKKSIRHSPTSYDFWNFSMDEFAFHDIPDSINYILATSGQPSLSYIGFSQGTAQAFATLSIHPTLNDKVDVFIGLAPAMSPAGLHNSVVDALMKASPVVIFLAFGRRSILSSATMWQSILYPPIFVRIIDLSLAFLFNWAGRSISPQQKLAAYPHLYSFTSTKSVVHWFQIIRNKSFQMFDDDVQAPLSLGASDRYYKVAKFPTRNIKTPIVLLYGGSDSLVDINIMLRELPKHTVVQEILHFEHLDFLWAQHVETLVFPYVFEALDRYAGRDHLEGHELMSKSIQNLSVSEDDLSSTTPGDASDLGLIQGSALNRKRRVTTLNLPSFIPLSTTSRLEKNIFQPSPVSTGPTSGYLQDMVEEEESLRTPKRSRLAFRSDRGCQRSGSVSSARSLELGTKFVKGGITLGASKATVGLVGNSPDSARPSDVDSPTTPKNDKENSGANST